MGCPIRRSRDQRSLAAPPSLSQLATSFIACDAKVSTCVLLCTLRTCPDRLGDRNVSLSFLEIASLRARNTRKDRSHVWHMKVLHYAVFNDQKATSLAAIRLRFVERKSKPEVVPSKLSSTVCRFRSVRIVMALGRACGTLRRDRSIPNRADASTLLVREACAFET